MNGRVSPGFILATSNGTGMGHLARQAAVALALTYEGAMSEGLPAPDWTTGEPVVFSLSTAVHVVGRHGLRAEYCPSYHREWMPHSCWHRYLGDRVEALLDETGAQVLVFDGVAPYLGLLRARARRPDVAFVWTRRGMWRPGAKNRMLAAGSFFDAIIEPGDIAAEADRGATASLGDAVRVPPITLLDQVPPLPRQQAAAALGLDPSRPTALVALGAGCINDTATPALAAIRSFLAAGEWQVAVTRAPLARTGLPAEEASRVHELNGVYPLVRYLEAFDAAVSAAGYNAVHELLPAGLPTVLVPNGATTTDDQAMRARWAEDAGMALCADEQVADGEPGSVAGCARRLLDPKLREELRDACAKLPPADGAAAVATILAGLAGDFAGHRAGPRERLQSIDLAARATAMRGLGPQATTVVRRVVGRSSIPGPSRRLHVRPKFTERLDGELFNADHPVEHLLPGSSAAYRGRRRAIARDVYSFTRGSHLAGTHLAG